MMSALIGIVMLASAISTADLRKEFPVAPQDQAVVRDAINRWNKKTGARSDMDLRIPIVVYLPRQRCVVLKLRIPAIGGTPAYCYHLKEDVLIEAADDVE
jgi:hypothetical protein